MMKTWSKLILGTIALFLSLAPIQSFAQVIEPITGLAVFDANGTRVGPVVGVDWSSPTPPGSGFNGGIWFSMKADETTLLFFVDRNSELWVFGTDELYFESSNCTGAPLFRTSFLNLDLLPSSPLVGGPAPGQAGGVVIILSMFLIPMVHRRPLPFCLEYKELRVKFVMPLTLALKQ